EATSLVAAHQRPIELRAAFAGEELVRARPDLGVGDRLARARVDDPADHDRLRQQEQLDSLARGSIVPGRAGVAVRPGLRVDLTGRDPQLEAAGLVGEPERKLVLPPGTGRDERPLDRAAGEIVN